MDAADRAQEQLEREEAAFNRRASDVRPVVGTVHCVDCCEVIAQARRVACPGCRRCADCARDYERGLQR